MDLRALRYFLMVAKEQSFTKAAEQLNNDFGGNRYGKEVSSIF